MSLRFALGVAVVGCGAVVWGLHLLAVAAGL